ncbi:MAG: large conductance mechanosensitive channel protein MscL [Angustibacter sp.]
MGVVMLKGFKDFMMKGNIVDLAVAVVIGTAFAALVAAFGKAIIQPIINAFPGTSSTGLGFSLRGGDLAATTKIDLSLIINGIIVFVITMAVVYFIFVVPMNKLKERQARGQVEAPAEPTEDVLLLQEIRDLLRTQQGGSAAGRNPLGTGL